MSKSMLYTSVRKYFKIKQKDKFFLTYKSKYLTIRKILDEKNIR